MFEFKLPIRDPAELVNHKAISELPAFLEDETDGDVLRELLCIIQRAAYPGAATIGQLGEILDSLDTDERRLWLNACRKSAGLEFVEEEHRKAMEALRIPDTRDLQLYINESGVIVSRTEQQDEAIRVHAEQARLDSQHAAQAADRAIDAAALDEHQRAVDEQARRETPQGVLP